MPTDDAILSALTELVGALTDRTPNSAFPDRPAVSWYYVATILELSNATQGREVTWYTDSWPRLKSAIEKAQLAIGTSDIEPRT